MANIKISELTRATGLTGAELFVVTQLGLNKSVITREINTYSYVIDMVGEDIFATPGYNTGLSSITDTDISTLLNAAIATLTGGGLILIRSSVIAEVTAEITDQGNSDIDLIFQKGSKLTAMNGLATAENPYSMIRLSEVDNWRIIGIRVDGNSENQETSDGNDTALITADGCTNILLENAYVENSIMFGFFVSGASRHCGSINGYFSHCEWAGIALGNTATGHGLFAVNNEVCHSGDEGIGIYCCDSLIAYNDIHDMDGLTGFGGNPHQRGMAIMSGSGFTLTGNRLIGNAINGCTVGVAVGPTIRDSIISNNYFAGIDSTDGIGMYVKGGNNVIEGNTILATGAGRCIVLGDSDDMVIAENKMQTENAVAIDNIRSDRTLIKSNWLKATNAAAINISSTDSVGVKVMDNDMSQSLTSITDSGSGTIYGNNIWHDDTYGLAPSE